MCSTGDLVRILQHVVLQAGMTHTCFADETCSIPCESCMARYLACGLRAGMTKRCWVGTPHSPPLSRPFNGDPAANVPLPGQSCSWLPWPRSNSVGIVAFANIVRLRSIHQIAFNSIWGELRVPAVQCRQRLVGNGDRLHSAYLYVCCDSYRSCMEPVMRPARLQP